MSLAAVLLLSKQVDRLLCILTALLSTPCGITTHAIHEFTPRIYCSSQRISISASMSMPACSSRRR